ncbi:urease accessory protein UreF [Prosthecomicrobium pneumaticum]|uniref:Urease accessory protein UreF n=1 Tax=Prosthecomicrobium pneumaticum TaxID=81895 RepID=A0A7W9CVH7_9HYPH|nr:urease accessory protein UreF [Prosthecomicrobium pneumaticum]MBB5752424.1 urease accessory protein [Prosthecomicrobium pneumaticum]
MADGAVAPAALEDRVDPAALHRLLAWLSPSFPVGAYTYSHGLEWAIEDGTVATAAYLRAWIGALLAHGAGRSDAILFRHAHAAAARGDGAGLAAIAELAEAFQPSAERRLEANAQGRAFLGAIRAAWDAPALEGLAAALEPLEGPTYAVAVASAAAAHGVPVEPALHAFLAAFVANIVSAGIRAVPLGQTDGQRIIAGLGPEVAAAVAASRGRPLDDLGGAAFRADIASMKHETQYTRLFRS